ncbi:MAG: permease-like cell division protein FtsX [Crocinitomicaceae bacterium]|nr:permease-like cell division protein FtsX [Crocinitomicaceae bacterium]
MSSSAEKYSKRGVTTSYVSTIIGISLVLFVISIIVGGSFALKSIQKQAKESLQADIFFKPEYSDADIKQVEQELRTWKYFKEVKFINSDQAINEIKGLGQSKEDIVGILDGEIAIPSNISFHPKEEYADMDGMETIKVELLKAYQNEIDEVHYDKESVSNVNLGFKRFVFLFGFIAMLLVIVATAMINNTIRLALYSQRFLIKTMQLVGATSGFIRKPFLIKAILQGVVSAVIGLSLFMLLVYITDNVMEVIELHLNLEMLLSLFIIIILLGVLISYVSTWFSLNKYLRMKVDDLY